MHGSLDEFKFRPDTTTNFRVICPCASEKLLYNVVSTLAPLFLIGSSSDEFEIRPDRTKDCGVICPCASEKMLNNVVKTLAPSFLSDLLHFCR